MNAPADPPRPPPLRIAPIAAPTLASVKPLPPAEGAALEPYRVLFPLGAGFAIAGVLPWIAADLGGAPWPGTLHAGLMIQGFELCFVTGFLLTAMPAFTHGAKCRGWELAGAVVLALAYGLLHAFGQAAAAGAAFALALAFTMTAVARRVRFGGAAPPEEFLLVATGLLLGVMGGALQALSSAGVLVELYQTTPAPEVLVGTAMTTTALLPGGSERITVTATAVPIGVDLVYEARVDGASSTMPVTECIEDDNAAQAGDRCSVLM